MLPETDGQHPTPSNDLELQGIHVTGRDLVGDIFDPTDENVVENRLNEKRTKTCETTRLHYTVYDRQLTVSLEDPSRKAGKLPDNSCGS